MDNSHPDNVIHDKSGVQECVENCDQSHNFEAIKNQEEFPAISSIVGNPKNAGRGTIPPASYKTALMKGDGRLQKSPMDGSGKQWSRSTTMYVLAR